MAFTAHSFLRLAGVAAVFLATQQRCWVVAAPTLSTNVRPSEGTVNAAGKYIPNDPALRPGARPPANPRAPQADELPQPRIEKQADGTIKVGLVTVDPKARTISFPAAVNQREGLIEYAIVTKTGKVHESLLSTSAAPLDLHVAALLLGLAQPRRDNAVEPIAIEVEWETNGPRRRETLEDMIKLAQDSRFGRAGTTLPRGGWSYTGSYVLRGQLAADEEGSILTLIGDPVALMANQRPDSADDKVHVPNPARMPSLGMPVTVRIHVPASGTAKP